MLVALSIAACVFVSVTYVSSTNTLVREIAEVALNETSNEIASWVDAKGARIDTLAKTMVELHDQPGKIQSCLSGVLADDHDFIDIFFGTSEPPTKAGYAVYASRWSIPGDYDWTTRPWFVQAVGKDGLVVSAPYKDLQTGKIIISISKQVYAEGKMIGVISSDISTETVREIAARNYIAKGSMVSLLTKDGDYIEAGNNDRALAGNAFASGALMQWKSAILSGSFVLHASLFADRYYASIGLPSLGWLMLATGPLSNFEDISRSMISLAAVLVVLATLFMVILGRSWRTGLALQVATDRIEEANKGLEKTVEERTASLRNILDNAGEGFLTFGPSLVIDPDFSKGCVDIFGKEIGGLSAPDVLFPGRTETIADFRQGFGLYFEGKSKASIIFDLTEKQTVIRERTIAITYKETAGRRILCILTDITLATEMAEKNRVETGIQQRVLRALHHKLFFAQFLEAADDLFARLEVYAGTEPTADESVGFTRAMHTFKGDAGFFCFTETQGLAHEAETLMSDSRLLGTTISYREMLSQLRKVYYRELKAITDAMGEKWLDEASGISMPRDAFQKLILYVRKKTPEDARLLIYLDSFRKISIAELFSRLPFVAAATAEKLGKKVGPMAIIGGTQKIVPDR